jgi:hypothetical protein
MIKEHLTMLADIDKGGMRGQLWARCVCARAIARVQDRVIRIDRE